MSSGQRKLFAPVRGYPLPMRSFLITLLLCAAPLAAQRADENAIASTIEVQPVSATAASLEAPHEFEAIALSWRGPARPFVRASVDGVRWTSLEPISVDADLTDGSDSRSYSVIHHFGVAQRFFEVQFDDRAGAFEVRATLFRPAAARSRFVEEAEPMTLRSRTEWGCPDGQGSRWSPAYAKITHAIVHHTAGSNAVTNWENEVRNIWYFHTVTRGWGDVGYNFLIDPNGVIYEGRAGGNGAIGAHFSCRNTNTVGVSLMGDFTATQPSPAALAALKRLLTEVLARNGVSPNVVAKHAPSTLDLNTISSHRDGNAAAPQITCTITSCPGDQLYSKLTEIRNDVAACRVPRFTSPAMTASTLIGGNVSLQVTLETTDGISLQWYEGARGDTSRPVAGATGTTLELRAPAGGRFWVRAANACASIDSEPIDVVVIRSTRRR